MESVLSDSIQLSDQSICKSSATQLTVIIHAACQAFLSCNVASNTFIVATIQHSYLHSQLSVMS